MSLLSEFENGHVMLSESNFLITDIGWDTSPPYVDTMKKFIEHIKLRTIPVNLLEKKYIRSVSCGLSTNFCDHRNSLRSHIGLYNVNNNNNGVYTRISNYHLPSTTIIIANGIRYDEWKQKIQETSDLNMISFRSFHDIKRICKMNVSDLSFMILYNVLKNCEVFLVESDVYSRYKKHIKDLYFGRVILDYYLSETMINSIRATVPNGNFRWIIHPSEDSHYSDNFPNSLLSEINDHQIIKSIRIKPKIEELIPIPPIEIISEVVSLTPNELYYNSDYPQIYFNSNVIRYNPNWNRTYNDINLTNCCSCLDDSIDCYELICNHTICRTCLPSWNILPTGRVNETKKCPMCRGPIIIPTNRAYQSLNPFHESNVFRRFIIDHPSVVVYCENTISERFRGYLHDIPNEMYTLESFSFGRANYHNLFRGTNEFYCSFTCKTFTTVNNATYVLFIYEKNIYIRTRIMDILKGIQEVYMGNDNNGNGNGNDNIQFYSICI
jgi:hypothetical protein